MGNSSLYPTRISNQILRITLAISLLGTILKESECQDIDSLLHNKRSYHAVSIGLLSPPKIDGIPDDTVWQLGKWQDAFTQQFPRGGEPATEQTRVKVVYDHSNLYVAMICLDSEPDKIRDILSRRDSRGGDMAGIALDSYFDKRTAFEFSLSAAGQKMDLKHLGDYHFDFNWDAVWDGASTVSDSGWIAEMQIPFSQLRYADRSTYVWGLHFYRVISRKQEATSWQHIPREAPAMVYLFGELHGLSSIQTSRQVEFLPYALGSLDRSQGSWNDDPAGYNAGLNAKVGISSDYTLDLAVNPDFGQVEADPSDLNLTSYETFFEEKRPFFLEGNDVFDFEIGGDIPYYSRRIGSAPALPATCNGLEITSVPDITTILGAAKLTGKSSRGLSVGLVNGVTARESGTATGETGTVQEIEVSPLTNYLASRVKRDFREGNTIFGGVFSMVNRFPSDSAVIKLQPEKAATGGLDLLHHWNNRNYYLEVKTIASRLSGTPDAILRKQLSHNHRFQRPDAGHLEVDSLKESLTGHGSLIRVGKKGGNWTYYLQGDYRSPGLNLNDMGYIRQSDEAGESAAIAYQMNEPGEWIRNYSLELSQELKWSFGGENTVNQVGLMADIRNNKLWSFAAGILYDFSTLDTRELRGGPALRKDNSWLAGVSVRTNSSKDLYGGLGYHHLGLGGPGSSQDILYADATWLPVKRLKFSTMVQADRRRYHQQYVATLTAASETEYVVSGIDHRTVSFTFRGELFITPELSLQYYGSPYYSVGDYRSFRRVSRPSAKDRNERLEDPDPVYEPGSDSYSYTYNIRSYRFDNPDFSFMQFRSNLVLRWEYKLGSTLYLVWSHDRSGWESGFNPVSDIMGDLREISGTHVFMVKINLWFSV